MAIPKINTPNHDTHKTWDEEARAWREARAARRKAQEAKDAEPRITSREEEARKRLTTEARIYQEIDGSRTDETAPGSRFFYTVRPR